MLSSTFLWSSLWIPLIISQGCLPSGTIAAQTVALDLDDRQMPTLAFTPTEIRGYRVYGALFPFAVTEPLDGTHPSRRGRSSQLFCVSLVSNQLSFPILIGYLCFHWEVSMHILGQFSFNWDPVTLTFHVIFTADFSSAANQRRKIT